MRRAVVVSDDSSGDEGSGDYSSGVYESDEYESDDGDAGAARRGLVDDEAEESGDDGAEESGDSSAGDSSAGARTFHGFVRLPPELRYRVWEAFCPDLLAKGRLLQFDLSPASSRHARAYPTRTVWTVKEWVTLPDQTEPLRRVMAAHGESRAVALKAFPDTLSIDSGSGDALVHFNRNVDVVLVRGIRNCAPNDMLHFPGFADRVLSVAAKLLHPHDDATETVRIVLDNLPNLKRIYFHRDVDFYRDRDIRWCISDYVHQYVTETFEKEPGLGENTLSVACWPDVDNHADFAKYQIPRVLTGRRLPEIDQMMEERGIETWPMVLFDSEEAMEQYRWLQDTRHVPNCEELVCGFHDPASEAEPADSETDEDEDEYESDGIDDAEIVEDDEASEDEIIPRALSDGPSSADEGDAAGARFSSPEPAPRRPKRRVVTDSDDDDGAAPAEPRAKRARTGRAIAVNSDDEEDAGPAPAPVVTISDSEADGGAGGAKTAATNGESGSSEDSSDEDSSDEDDSVPKQRVSLAERLRMSREAIPIPSSDGEGGSTDDEEGEEDDDEDEDDDSEDGLIDGMAAESDGEGEGESDDGW